MARKSPAALSILLAFVATTIRLLGVSSLTRMPHESMFPLTARRATTGSMTAAISTSWGSVQRQRAASTTLGSAYVNPEKEARAGEKMVEDRMGMASNGSTSTSSGEDVWFFAIGSMMNPNSLRNRSIKPLQSTPGVLNDFDLIFTGGMGFAEAVRCPGKSFHGVLVSYFRTSHIHSIFLFSV